MLLDTSGLLCYLHRDEAFHAKAVVLLGASKTTFTHAYVLAELVALAQVRGLPRQATLTFIADVLDHPDIETVWVDEPLHRAALLLLMKRADKTYSLCDAVSFVLLRQRRVLDALTTDRHFEQEGFNRLLKP